MDFDDLGVMAESEEDDYSPVQIQIVQLPKQDTVKSLKDKREQFRIQIRKDKTNKLLLQKRFTYIHPLQPPIQDVLKTLSEAMQNFETQSIISSLSIIALISNDENNINCLYLIKLNFISQAQILIESDDPLQLEHIFVILSCITKLSEFLEFDHDVIMKTILRGQDVIKTSNQHMIEIILIYFSHVCELMPEMRNRLVEAQFIQILNQLNLQNKSLQKTIVIFVDIFSSKYPAVDQMGPLFLLVDKCLNMEFQSDLLQAILTICKQASLQSMRVLIDTKIIRFLFEILNGQMIEQIQFYSALTSIKFISMSCEDKIEQMLVECGIFEIVDSFVYHKYQKLRTATLHIVMSLCHNVLRDSIQEKLINVLVSDIPVNKALVLQIIINIMTYGSDSDFTKLLDLGVIKQLLVTLEDKDVQILLLVLKCCEILINFGQSQMIKQSLTVNPILQKMLACNINKIVEHLQKNENEEVYVKANQFIQDFFEYEMQ